MKTIVLFLSSFFLYSSFISQNAKAQDLKYEFLFEAKAIFDSSIYVGKTPLGERLIVPIKSGTFKGPELNGKLLKNGGDWLLRLDSITSKLDIRAVLETEDGAKIYITSSGWVHSNPDNSYYFRINPIFETSSEKYKWLNYTIAVGVGTYSGEGAAFKIYAIK